MAGGQHQVSIKVAVEASSATTELPKAGRALDELGQKAEQAAARTGRSFAQTEMSAKQTTAALRQLPMQMTDIFTGLASGQAPMTVLIQQGGQLKDTFGGIAPAAKAVSGYVAGMVNPLTLAAGAVVALGAAAYQGRREHAEHANALILSGNAAGVTASQMQDMARALAEGSHTQMASAAAINELARSTAVGGQELQRYAGIALDWERVTGQAVSETADRFKALKDEPLAASIKLNEGLNYLTASTYEHIKALVEQGRQEEAGNVAQDALAKAMAERTRQITQNQGFIERGWHAIKGAAVAAWDAMLNVGRSQTNANKLAGMRKELADLESTQARAGFASNGGGAAFGRPNLEADNRRAARIAQLKSETAELGRVMEAERREAEAKAESAKKTQALIDLDSKYRNKLKTDQQRAREQRAEIEELGKAAGLTAQEIRKLQDANDAAVIKPARGGGGRSAALKAERAEARALAQDLRNLAQSAGLSPDFYKDWEALNATYKRGRMSVDDLTAAQAKLLAQQPAIKQAAEERRKEEEALAKAQAALREEEQRRVAAYAKQVDQMADGNQRLRDEVALIGLSKEQQALYEQAKIDSNVAIKEEQLARMQNEVLYTREQAALEEEIRLLKERRDLLGERALKESAIEAERAVKQADKSMEQLGQSLADNLMRGGKNAKQYLEDIFRTAVLRPVLAPIMGSIAGGVTSMLGMGGGSQGGGLGGMGSLLNAGSSLLGGSFGSFLGLGNIGAGFGAGWGALLGGNIGGGLSAGWTALAAGNIGGGLGTLAGVAAPILAPLALLAMSGAFSRKHEQHNLQGTFGGESGFEGAWHDYYRGGLFRSSKTVDTPLEASFLKSLRDAWKASEAAVTDYAKTLGLSTEAIDGFTYSINLKLKDIDPKATDREEQIMARVQQAIRDGNNEMAQLLIGTWETTEETVRRQVRAYGDELGGWTEVEETITRQTYVQSEYAREGEQAIDTLTRLATSLQTVNATFEMLGDTMLEASLAGGDLASRLVDAMGGAQAWGNASGSYLQNYFTEDERREMLRRQIERELGTAGLAMPTDRADFRRMEEQLRARVAAGDEDAIALYAALMKVNAAFAQLHPTLDDVARAAEEALQAAADAAQQAYDVARARTDDAWGQLSALFDQQIEGWQGVADEAREIFSLAGNAARELRSNVGSTRLADARSGNQFINEALEALRLTGALPDAAGLGNAVTAARGGLDMNRYATVAEFERDQLVLAGKLGEISDRAGEQKSFAEQQVDLLKRQLDYWQTAMDEARRTGVKITSIEQGVGFMADALRAELEAQAALEAAQAAAASGGGGSAGSAAFGGGAGGGASRLTPEQIAAQAETLRAQDWYGDGDWSRVIGYSVDTVAAAIGAASGDLEKYLAGQGLQVANGTIIPRFASGGVHQGGMAMVGEEGPELVHFGRAGRIYSAGETQRLLDRSSGETGVSSARVAELLTQLLARMGQIERHTGSTASTLSKVTGNGNMTRVELVANRTAAEVA